MASVSAFSNPDADKRCEACGRHPAYYFICKIIEGVKTELALCEACATAQGFMTHPDGTSIHEAKCDYCGAQPANGSMNQPWELPHRQKAMHYTCLRCTGLYGQFMLESLATTPQDLPLNEQLQRLQALTAETDARVKAAVAD